MLSEFKNRFYENFSKLISTKRDDNSAYLSLEKYDLICNQVKDAKQQAKKTALSYRRLAKYDLVNVGNDIKLIVPLQEGKEKFVYYVKNEELFDILYEAHINIGHGGRTRMLNFLNDKYKNITQEVVSLFLKFCIPCQQKIGSKRKGLVVKPMIFSEVNSRCQVDLIDMQSDADGPFRFIFVYQDHLTKFVQLRSLTSKKADEVATHLIEIFCIFGAPSILQSDNGREFANSVINELKNMWPDLKIVHGKPRHSQSQGSVERANRDIQDMLITWMQTNITSKWSEGLKFIQLMKNRAFHAGIIQSPYEAMFGSKIKVGLSDSIFPKDCINQITTEEDLQHLVDEVNSAEENNNREVVDTGSSESCSSNDRNTGIIIYW